MLRDSRLPREPLLDLPLGSKVPLDPMSHALLRLELQNRVNAALADAPSLGEAAPRILQEIAATGQWDFAGLWQMDEKGERLRFAGSWPVEGGRLEPFLERSRGLTLGSCEGLPGFCWAENRALWLADFEGSFRFLRLDAAHACGLRSGCCFPIRLEGRVLGVMEFFSRERREEEPEFLAVLDNLGNQIGQFEGRQREQAALRRSEARFRAVVERAVEGMFLLDLDSMRIIEANRAFLELVGYSIEELKSMTLYQLVDHDPASVDENARKAVEAGDVSLGERRYRRRDGSTVTVEVGLRHLGLESGQIVCALVHDVSSRKAAESERTRLLEILEATPDFVGVADLEGRVVYGNRALERLRGRDSADLRRPILDAHPPWAARLVLEEGLPTAMEKGIWRGETALLDQEGHEVPISQVIVAHRDEQGRPTFFSTIARDITEEKHNEHHLWTLLKNYQDLKYAVDESTIFAVTDVRGRILDVNERFCEVAGYGREELIGKDHRILNSGLHSKRFFQELWQTILSGRTWRGEIRNRAKDGSFYWVDATIVPWLGEDGQPERFIALRSVITDRKLAEERLRRREAQLEVLLRASRDLNADLEVPAVLRKLVQAALQLTGAGSGCAGLVVDGELAIREVCAGGVWMPLDFTFASGRGVAGLVQESASPCIVNDAGTDLRVDPDFRAKIGYTRLIGVPIQDRSGATLGCFEVHDPVDGRPFGEEDLWVLQGLADAASSALGNARMIEERERQEAVLRHAQKLESLGVLAGGIAHDFNNLLTTISGNVALAQMHAASGQEAFLQSIDDTVQRAADLTRQLLAYAGKGRSVTRFLDLNGLVEEMTKLLSVSCSKKAELGVHLEPVLPAIQADPAQLQQVVMNLVINASEALEGRPGWIRVTTGLQEVAAGTALRDTQGQALAPGRYVVLTVADSGCGMTPEVQARIFDPFFTTKARGHGLGLSAMLGILRGHGARVRLDSAPGEGSAFSLYFPPVDMPAEAIRAEPAPTAWQGGGRLLLVDDEAEIRHALAPLLRSLGFEVVEASNGREAVARYQREGPFRLVLMDLSMPHMDGLEALREIRAADPDARAIILSGFDPTGSPSFEVCSAAYLPKPFRFDRLKEALRQALGSV